jgi:uncharacterized protein (DUF488 family)
MINIFTIGAYNSTEDSYFNKLRENHIDLFCDIRQRRGVRGSQYKYVNSNYLQEKLKDLDIPYEYIKELAPTSEIRQKQKEADKLNNETKKMRTKLGTIFANEYRKQILANFDMNTFAKHLTELGVRNVVFFCVEEHAEACHRSLVAKELSDILKSNITNL